MNRHRTSVLADSEGEEEYYFCCCGYRRYERRLDLDKDFGATYYEEHWDVWGTLRRAVGRCLVVARVLLSYVLLLGGLVLVTDYKEELRSVLFNAFLVGLHLGRQAVGWVSQWFPLAGILGPVRAPWCREAELSGVAGFPDFICN